MLDRIDRAVLRALEMDARLSYAELGERVGLSKSPCWKRVQTLENDGIVRGYRAIIDADKVGLRIRAFAQVRVEFDQHSAFEAEVSQHPAVIACYTTAGDADYLLELLVTDIGELDQILRKQLSGLPGVQRFATTITMRTIKSDGSIAANIR